MHPAKMQYCFIVVERGNPRTLRKLPLLNTEAVDSTCLPYPPIETSFAPQSLTYTATHCWYQQQTKWQPTSLLQSMCKQTQHQGVFNGVREAGKQKPAWVACPASEDEKGLWSTLAHYVRLQFMG